MRGFNWTPSRILIALAALAALIVGIAAIIAGINVLAEMGLLELALWTLGIMLALLVLISIALRAVKKKHRG